MDLWNAPNAVIVPHHLMWIQFESNEDTYVDNGFFIKIETTYEHGKIKIISIHFDSCQGIQY